MASKTTFWDFLKNNLIEIPIIQRDYAQGRLGKENLRKSFLADLKKALDDNAKMKLDFVYGSIENNKLNPLDGQQRLTTLWLLHWYVALRAGVLNEENCRILRKFTYETRMSSREFCQSLCVPKNFEHFNCVNIVGFITNQTWFYSAWKQDPTIQSMLRMLSGTKVADKKGVDIIDGIEELFVCPSLGDIDSKESSLKECPLKKTFKSYWEKLTNESLCPIVFYNLSLHDFGLSDDLYIKMNARGKQLTSFENFKADLIGYIANRADEDIQDKAKWESFLHPVNGIPIKFDTVWTDIFWKNKSIGIPEKDDKSVKSNQIDEIFFAFLNRFFWNELFIAKDSKNTSKYLLDIGKGDENSTQENENPSYRYLNDSNNRNPNDYDTKIAYHGLDEYKYDNGIIPVKLFLKLQSVLNNYCEFSKNWTIPDCPWDGGFRFIPEYIKKDENFGNIEIMNNANEKILKVSTLSQVQRIVFFAICKYFDHDEKVVDDEDSMKRWMRVVWNLISGIGEDGRPQIRSTMAIRTAIEHIERLDAHNVYKSLSDMDPDEQTSDFSNRWNEEINKAKQIIDENNNLKVHDDGRSWEAVIIEAEQYAFFNGSIRFLFQNEKGEVDWSSFDEKLKNVKQYFLKETPSKGSVMKEQYRNADLLKLMMSWYSAETFENVLWWKHRTFNNKPETWLYYLLNNDNCNAIHHLLLGEKNQSNSNNCDSEKNQSTTPFEDYTWEDFCERTVCKLAYTSLLDFVIDKIPNSWIRDYHNHKAIFPSSTGVFLNSENRDNLLSDTEGIDIMSEHKIDNTSLLFGSDINFTFNDQRFQWYRDDYVYLMDNDSRRMIKNENEQEDIKKYYCFNTQSITNTDDFKKALNELMNSKS